MLGIEPLARASATVGQPVKPLGPRDDLSNFISFLLARPYKRDIMSNLFPLSLLQAVSDWQRGGDANQNIKRGQKLKEASGHLPDEFRTCSLCCFRQMSLPKGGVWSLIGEDRLPEKISSWTPDLEVAMRLKGGVPPEGQGYQGVIFCLLPPPGSVIIDLQALYRDQDFVAALEQNKQSIVGYYDGAGRYGSTQSEVVLEVAAVTQQDIYSLGGHSSPFDDLVEYAAKLIFGRPATDVERDALMLKVDHIRQEAGPMWLRPEATQRVLTNTHPHAERLRDFKQQQEASKH